MRVLPILFNTGMVQAIMDGRKTATRRTVKLPVNRYTGEVPKPENLTVHKNTLYSEKTSFSEKPFYYFEIKPPCHMGDILYIRETWAFLPCMDCTREGTDCGRTCVTYEDKDSISDGCFVYRAEHPTPDRVSWSPSIHMPKAAARIWLRVTGVRVERLQDIDDDGIVAEGLEIGAPFEELWDSTIKKSDLDRYGWDANPWVWVIEFERCEKPKEG